MRSLVQDCDCCFINETSGTKVIFIGFFVHVCARLCVCTPQIHLKNRELENTKLSAELQMLKSVDVNKENTIAQFKEEVGRLQACLTEKEKQYREILAKVSPLVQKI